MGSKCRDRRERKALSDFDTELVGAVGLLDGAIECAIWGFEDTESNSEGLGKKVTTGIGRLVSLSATNAWRLMQECIGGGENQSNMRLLVRL